MKRKRTVETAETRQRPFKKKIELLNECLCLTLKYNIHFLLPSTDLTWYRYAETLEKEQISNLMKEMTKAIEKDEYTNLEQVSQRI